MKLRFGSGLDLTSKNWPSPKKIKKVNKSRKKLKNRKKKHPEVLHRGIFVPNLLLTGRNLDIEMMTHLNGHRTRMTDSQT